MSNVQPLHSADVNQVVADNLHAELRRQRWSDRGAATALGVTHTYISRRTRGETPLSPADIVMFTDLLHISVAKLFEGMQKGPETTIVSGPTRLPDLDSNQEPAVISLAARRRDTHPAEDRHSLAPVTSIRAQG